MDLQLTGTGPVSGFPVPGCPCATCRLPRLPQFPRLSRLPAELRLTRAGENAVEYRLDVHGQLHDPDRTVIGLQPGETRRRDGFRVTALSKGGLLIHQDDEKPLLWAPQAGRLSEESVAGLAGLGLAAVFLGPGPDEDPQAPTDDPGLVDAASTLARLRAVDAVVADTATVLLGLGHRQGPADRLAICLQHWQVQTPADGSPVALGRAEPALDRPRRTLVLGGSASGKSGLAEDLLAAEPEVLYTATGPVVDLRTEPDAEWARRVQRHRERRPSWWRTEETHLVAGLLARDPAPILLDSIGTWLTGVLDRSGAWSDEDGWRERVGAETEGLVRAWRARTAPLVAVSDEVGLGVVPATASGRMFRDELGRLNRRLAQESEQVLVVVAGQVLSAR